MNSTTEMEQIGKYWGVWGSTMRRGNTTSPIPSWSAAASPYSSEPSWEEQAFARDAAAHLGGCVWPPRSYSCSFCQREFRSAQALGGHMNVHRRDRALLRQGSSLDDSQDEAPLVEHPGGGAFFCRPTSNPSAMSSSIAVVTAAQGEVNHGTSSAPPSYLTSIIKESKNKVYMSIPASTTIRVEEAKDQCDHDDDVESGRMNKRRRLDHPPSITLQIFSVQTTTPSIAAKSELQGVDHDAKVLKAIISNPSSVLNLVDQQDVDLELRLGRTPKVT